MKNIVFAALSLLFAATNVLAQCTLNKPVIDVERIKKDKSVQSIALRSPSEATVLMKNGSALYIRYEGCVHIGMQGVLWIPKAAWANELPAFEDTTFWLKKTIDTATVSLKPEQVLSFKALLDAKKTTIKTNAETFNFSAATKGAETYSVTGQSLPAGMMLIIEYVFDG